jgi:hypothetical protein
MEGASNIQHHFDEKNGFLALIIEFLVLAAYYFRARPALYLPFAFIYCIVFRGGFYYWSDCHSFINISIFMEKSVFFTPGFQKDCD